MKWIRDKKYRLLFSLLAATAAVTLAAAYPSGIQSTLAWWGTLYPQFCFQEPYGREDNGESGEISIGEARIAETGALDTDTASAQARPRFRFWITTLLTN